MDNLIDGNENSILLLQQYGIDWLYDLELQQNNLFYVSQFQEDSVGSTKTQNPDDDANINISPYFRVKSVKMESPSLTFKWHPTMRMNILDNVDTSKTQAVSIVWIEDVYKSVYQYHLNWLNSWYNVKGDYLPVGSKGKFRNLYMTVFHFIDTTQNITDLLSNPNPMAEWLFKIKLGGMSPESFGQTSLSFDMGQSQSTTGLTANYKINSMSIQLNKKIYGEGGTFYMPNDSIDPDSAKNGYYTLARALGYENTSGIRIL